MSTKTATRLLGRDDILGSTKLPTEIVPAPEWGGAVTVRGMTGMERGRYETSAMQLTGNDKGGVDSKIVNPELLRMRLVSICTIDGDGKQLFSEADLLVLGQLNAAPLERIASAARRLSGLTEKDMESLTAGLKDDRNGSSGSDSPVT